MNEKVLRKSKYCRVCKKPNLEKVLTLGPTPLANAFLTKSQSDEPEYFYPLDVDFCSNCGFIQLGHVVAPKVLFENYVYVSSTSPVFINHFEKMADYVSPRFLGKDSLVIDIGSNDGILLKPFKALGTRVLGIEPAKHIAKIAEKTGIETISEFFSIKLAKKIVKQKGQADIVTATNVFAHIDNLDEVIEGLKILLHKDGIFIMEAPYLIDFIEKRYFDLVYHEHLSYWSINSLITLFKRFNMIVFDVQKVPVHGGTIRVYLKKTEGKHRIEKSVQEFLGLEKKMKLTQKKTYLDYANLVLKNKVKLIALLAELKIKGKTIAAYGAPAKGNTLLNYFGIGPEILEYVVDDSPWKQGLYTPGKRIPVVSSKTLYEKRPDYLLILAWNFADSIMKMHDKYKKLGGKFIIPVPKPIII
ncbi:MAG: class I SAM-dependent methyltransferase [Candidatus Levybacteria bacterium]|nr:class I SAM-dependent methyltransferase [Candidatus Levybacteria bacterium]